MLQNPLPAIMIGGPPHSGKSVLAYHLTQMLRELQVDHYLLRACPDGEGDWSNEANQQTVQTIRFKQEFTANFVSSVRQAIDQRLLPLLVDVGGRPQPEQEAILAACTHAILIAQTAEQLATWRDLSARLQIPVIAELISSLTTADAVTSVYPLLAARIHGLDRHTANRGPALHQLAGLARAVLVTKRQALRDYHLAQAPVETTVDLERLTHTLQTAHPGRWQPQDLPSLLAYLPRDEPMAIYGRSPTWIYSALACYTATVPFHQFDARLGWVQPPVLSIEQMEQTVLDGPHWRATVHERATYPWLEIALTDPYLNYAAAHGCVLPALPRTNGVILSGRMPLWLLTAIARAYLHLPWLAVYQPSLQGAVVIHGSGQNQRVGTLLPVAR